MNTPVAQRRPLGQILISEGILSEDQLRIALLEQMKCNQPIGKLLVSLGFVTEATLRQALSESLGKQSIDLRNAVVDPQALKLVPRELAKRHHLLPLDYDAEHHRLTVAIADVNDIVALDRVRSLAHDEIEIDTLLAGETEIDRAIDLAYGYAREGMTAYVDLQEREFAAEGRGYTATKHQREVGAGYFDKIATTVDPNTSTAALKGSTEEGQFH